MVALNRFAIGIQFLFQNRAITFTALHLFLQVLDLALIALDAAICSNVVGQSERTACAS